MCYGRHQDTEEAPEESRINHAVAFQVLPGLGHEAGKAIGLHPDIDAVGFTGASEVGKKFLSYSARSNMKRTGSQPESHSGVRLKVMRALAACRTIPSNMR